METIEIYWNDLTKEKQEELIEAGMTDENIIDGVFPVATIFLDEGIV